eukprot:TRINITY_DN23555_c0_g1_i1.p1 TRINITY_DN23555_c0_g1~~TRINITY_DN23555_c0_g1_i1.p1  ORF type:complete len:534 (+),score=69.39 TRINITY_DN23555_c0_g1_i1:93-1694(+)
MEPLPPPLTDVSVASARYRLQGPRFVQEEFARDLNSVPTTVNEEGSVRFGDSLLLLHHGTEVLLQADRSLKDAVPSGVASRGETVAMRLTTGRALLPCARNSWMAARADRSDGFMDSLDVHYGQEICILTSPSLFDEALYLHLEAGPKVEGASQLVPMLVSRGARRARWRVLPAPRSYSHVQGNEAARNIEPAIPTLGQVVRVNESVSLESVSCAGYLLVSDIKLVHTAFGAECEVFGEIPPTAWPSDTIMSDAHTRIDGPKRATWSFVNDVWADRVAAVEALRRGPIEWKDEIGDNFAEQNVRVEPEIGQPPFQPPSSSERQRRESLVAELARKPESAFVGRIFAALRAKGGMHGVRRARRACRVADTSPSARLDGSGVVGGSISVSAFKGILGSRGVLLQSRELDALCRAFHAEDDVMNYSLFFDCMEGSISNVRCGVIERAYRKLQRVAQGSFVTVDDLLANWNPRCYPEVVAGELEQKEAFQDFFSQWEVGHHEGRISAEDFMSYYSDVSMAYADSDQFIEMLRTAYDL